MLYQSLEPAPVLTCLDKGRQVLIVDDHSDNLDILDHMLCHQNYSLYFADSGAEALKMAECELFSFDCFLIDLMMPEISGLEVIQKIRHISRYRHVPVIVQTANRNSDRFNALEDYNIYYYLKKPYDKETLVTIMASALQYKERQDNLAQQLAHIARTMGRFQTFEATISELQEVQHLADMAACCFPKPQKVVNGIIELLMNALEHGALGISYEEKRDKIRERCWKTFLQERLRAVPESGRRVTLRYEKSAASHQVIIRDPGKGFDTEYYLRNAEALSHDPNGRGIWIAKTLCFDELVYNRTGNIVVASSRSQ